MFKLRAQVFLAFVGFALLLTLGLFGYSRLSFDHSFNRYLKGREAERNAALLQALAQHYQQQGSWQAFEQPGYWAWFIGQYRRMHPPPWEGRRDGKHPAEPRDLPPPGGQHRFILQDAERRTLAGELSPREHYVFSKIKAPGKGKPLGYLGSPINPALRDLMDNQFAERQQRHFAFMTLLALSIALLCALPLSQLLTRRVQRLARHVQQLSQGEYDQRLPVRGRDELTQLAQHLNHLGESLAQSEQTRKRWVADISHELRTPLAVLQADLEALEDGVRPLDVAALARLQKHAARLTRLVNDLYELSLTDIGALSYRKQECDLRELVGDLCHSLEDKFAQAGLAFCLENQGEPLVAFVDPQRIQQLLLNLLNNSLNYTNSPGQVRLSLTRTATSAQLCIDDSAPGVDTEQHEKLFERLYRAESSRSRDTGGAGLGLSICRNIVSAHGGHISIGNSPLGGLQVLIQLPLNQPHLN